MIELIIVSILLVLGYLVGSSREKKHYASIKEREAKLRHIMVFESKHVPASANSGELVYGNVVISTDYFKMFVAGLRKLVGGRLTTFESLLDRGRREAILRLKQEAVEIGASSVFNVRFETSSVSQGANGYIGSIEVLAYGSAVTQR